LKTNAARILETLGIPYELRDYDPGDTHMAAEEVARRVSLPPEQVFKTLVVRGDKHGVALPSSPRPRSSTQRRSRSSREIAKRSPSR
jgi:Cys-tRNA(Pro)/Cys-tRNA(Cys) deacylase